MNNKEEILKKLEELNQLVLEEQNAEQKTLIDFFKPSMDQMLSTIAKFVEKKIDTEWGGTDANEMKNLICSYIRSIDINNIMNNMVEPRPEWMKEVEYELSQGNKLQAVKMYKEKANVGLKEAKESLEALYPYAFYTATKNPFTTQSSLGTISHPTFKFNPDIKLTLPKLTSFYHKKM